VKRAVLLLLLLAVIVPARDALAQRTARRSWWDRAAVARSKYYVIKTDLPAPNAQAYARHLDRMYEEYARRLASLPPRAPEKLNVYIFSKREEYLGTLRARWRIDGTGTGGMFFVKANGSGLALWTESLPARRVHHVIQHEGFHQFAWSRFGGDLPIWVNEGLAEFFGHAVLVGDRLLLGQSTPRAVRSVQNAIESKSHVPFSRMLTMTGASWSRRLQDGTASVQYDQAWSMVQFLVYGDGSRYQQAFEQYLRRLNGGVPSERAFVEVFGADIDAFERRWTQFAKAARPGAFLTALERIEFIAEGALELSRRGAAPASLESLAAALEAIGFRHGLEGHGHSSTLSADDEANFLIPDEREGAERPVFVVEAPKRRRMTRKEQRFEERRPMPASIRTSGLRDNLQVRWIRDGRTGDLRYEIVVARR
jgi:hypothetical protein